MLTQARGATLIGLITSLLIVAIVSGVVFVSWDPTLDDDDAINTSEQIKNDLRLTQTTAMARNLPYRLNLLTNATYDITDTTGTPINHPIVGTADVNLPVGTTMTWANLPNNYILFNGQGIPMSAPGTALTTNATISITNTSGTVIVTLSPETGWAS